MTGLASIAVTLALIAGNSFAAEIANVERGRALYENHCQVCHTLKVHQRANRLPVNRDELQQIVENWQREENLRWNRQDVADVVQFLNQTIYSLP